jgi:transposase-like protein
MYKSISKDIRDQVLTRVKEGKEKVSVIAEQHGISPKTVYGWLSKGVDNVNRDQLIINRITKENLQLKQMIGELMFEKKREKKLK